MRLPGPVHLRVVLVLLQQPPAVGVQRLLRSEYLRVPLHEPVQYLHSMLVRRRSSADRRQTALAIGVGALIAGSILLVHPQPGAFLVIGATALGAVIGLAKTTTA